MMLRHKFNRNFSKFYQKGIQPVLFSFNPEKVHDRFIKAGNLIGKTKPLRSLTASVVGEKYAANTIKIFGKTISSPIMLSAGFDKNANLVKILPSLGFGGAEIGTVTMRPYTGNGDVRLTRVKKLKGILVNYGLANVGINKFLTNFANRDTRDDFLWGVSIAPTNDSAQSSRVEDLVNEYVEIYPLAADSGTDYITLNVSCPNTSCGQPFLEPKNLRLLLTALDKIKPGKPTTLKLSPDLDEKVFIEILEVADKYPWIKGIICTNLTKKFNRELLPKGAQDRPGGLSGPEIFPKMLKMLRLGKSKTGERFTWIACGGISSSDDIKTCLKAGATAVQMITAMIYQGPTVVAKLNYELAQKAVSIKPSIV